MILLHNELQINIFYTLVSAFFNLFRYTFIFQNVKLIRISQNHKKIYSVLRNFIPSILRYNSRHSRKFSISSSLRLNWEMLLFDTSGPTTLKLETHCYHVTWIQKMHMDRWQLSCLAIHFNLTIDMVTTTL